MLRSGRIRDPAQPLVLESHAGSPAPGCAHRQAGTGEEGQEGWPPADLGVGGSQPEGDSAGLGDWPGEAVVLDSREENSDAEWTAQLLILSGRASDYNQHRYQFLRSRHPWNNVLFKSCWHWNQGPRFESCILLLDVGPCHRGRLPNVCFTTCKIQVLMASTPGVAGRDGARGHRMLSLGFSTITLRGKEPSQQYLPWIPGQCR